MIDTQLLETIAADQAEMFAKKPLGVPRLIDFDKYVATKHIVVISGVRRSGKSTLLAQFSRKLQPFHFITFDDERLLDFSVQDFQSLLLVLKKRSDAPIILLDEVQNVVGWERFVRRLHDEGYKVFVTGSNAKLLGGELSTHLTGRYLKIELFPFSFREFLTFRSLPIAMRTTAEQSKVAGVFDEYLSIGGFPEMVATKDSEVLKNIYEDVLYRDLITRFKIRDVKLFRQLAQYLLTNIATEVSYLGLSKLIGAKSPVSIKRYVTFLTEAYLVGEVYKYDWSLKKQFVSNKKIYAIDTGMRNHVAFTFSEDKGRLLENVIYLELRRRGKDVFYFKDTRECDFIIRDKNHITQAFQVTMTISADNEEREVSGLLQALERCHAEVGTIITYSQRKNIQRNGFRIEVVPITEWLLCPHKGKLNY